MKVLDTLSVPSSRLDFASLLSYEKPIVTKETANSDSIMNKMSKDVNFSLRIQAERAAVAIGVRFLAIP